MSDAGVEEDANADEEDGGEDNGLINMLGDIEADAPKVR